MASATPQVAQGRLLLAVMTAAAVLAAFPGLSQAATVSVGEQTGDVNRAELTFEASPGEQNELKISLAKAHGAYDDLEVVDSGTTLAPGPGCSGGGGPAVPVTCTMHAPKAADQASCGHSCFLPVRGTAWTASVIVDLGDGDDLLDAGTLPGRFSEAFVVNAIGGAGDDTITSASANDTVDPGPGNDIVHTGDGHDTAFALAEADGDDLYDLGVDNFDKVSYAARSTPVQLQNDVAGGVGENDSLPGVEYVAGGAADDTLVGHQSYSALDGEGGNDLLIGGAETDYLLGGPGNDVMRGGDGIDHLIGGDGDDVYEGGGAFDTLFERPRRTTGDNLSTVDTELGTTGGDDVADAGPGNDWIELGPGADRVAGGEGDDSVHGEDGADVLDGGPGNDTVAGESGADQMLGGSGSDLLLAGRTNQHRYTTDPRPVDTWRDSLDCGPDDDRARANRWDTTVNCEEVTLVRALDVRAVEHHLRAGTARLSVEVVGPGRVTLYGRGASRVHAVTRAAGGDKETVYLPVGATGRTLTALRQRGRVRVTLWVTFQPSDGIARKEPVRLQLTLRSPQHGRV
jgi:hypothetical protein